MKKTNENELRNWKELKNQLGFRVLFLTDCLFRRNKIHQKDIGKIIAFFLFSMQRKTVWEKSIAGQTSLWVRYARGRLDYSVSCCKSVCCCLVSPWSNSYQCGMWIRRPGFNSQREPWASRLIKSQPKRWPPPRLATRYWRRVISYKKHHDCT